MINIPKGTKDVLPEESYKWQYVEGTARKIAALYGLNEVRTPTFEHTELFLRGVGDTTDVVNKEMYTFKDKGDRSITLKPEGTAGVARLYIENGLSSSALPAKMYYITPAFRYERPQAGRLREFHQFGVEIFGSASPDADAEVIMLAGQLLNTLGLSEYELNINSIGCKACRADYNKALKEFLRPHLGELCETCQSRFEKNPLRMLDCKEEGCRKYMDNAPRITDYLCPDCRAHFVRLQEILNTNGVKYKINPQIVRGLDYYSRTVFEFVSSSIGTQGTVCGGGRYDSLIESLGGASTPAVGFGVGIERLMLLMESTGVPFAPKEGITVYIAGMTDEARIKALCLAQALRSGGVSCDVDHMQRSIKAQFKYAGKIGAKYVAVIGEDELKSGVLNVKNMATGEQSPIAFADAINYFKENK